VQATASPANSTPLAMIAVRMAAIRSSSGQRRCCGRCPTGC
jgi:hypothetical protein